MNNQHYETDNEEFPTENAYQVVRQPGIAFSVLGWETEPDEDTEWSGYEVRTGNVLAVMIGDDRQHSIDPADISPLPREKYCGQCGQIGCSHDGYDRS